MYRIYIYDLCDLDRDLSDLRDSAQFVQFVPVSWPLVLRTATTLL